MTSLGVGDDPTTGTLSRPAGAIRLSHELRVLLERLVEQARAAQP